MSSNTHTPNTRNQPEPSAPGWLLEDLEDILDNCLATGEYEDANIVAQLLDQAATEGE